MEVSPRGNLDSLEVNDEVEVVPVEVVEDGAVVQVLGRGLLPGVGKEE